MLGTDEVMQWLRSLGCVDGEAKWTMARLDAAQPKRVGVYPRPDYAQPDVALGGRGTTLTRVKPVQVLVHWTKGARETERAAQALYDALAFRGPCEIGGWHAAYIELLSPEPVDLGADDNGIFERVVRFDIHYQEGAFNG